MPASWAYRTMSKKSGMGERFAAVEEVDVENEVLGLVDDLLEQVEIHEPLLLLGQVLVRAHDAGQVADARRLDPETERKVGQPGLFRLVSPENLPEPPVVTESFHDAVL